MINFDCSYQFIYHEYKCNNTSFESVIKTFKDINPNIISNVVENFRPNVCLICLFEDEDKYTNKNSIKLLETEIKLENIKRIKCNSERLHYNVMLKNQNKLLINLLDETRSSKKLDFINQFLDD